MSQRIVPIGWRQFEKFLRHVGCIYVGQEGSHRKWRRQGLTRPIIVPRRLLTVSLIRNNLRTLGISHEEYTDTLKHL